MKIIMAILVCAALLGCETSMRHTLAGRLQEEGHSKAYAKGYADGCRSWKAEVRTRDHSEAAHTRRSTDDPDYREGWDEGYDNCKTKDQPWNPALRFRQ